MYGALIGAAAILLVDQLSKAWASSALLDHDIAVIPSVLKLHLTENIGVAFGLFQGAGGSVFGIGAAAAVVVVLFALRSSSGAIEAAGLSLIMGGALGNLVDRATRGSGLLDGPVVDWIQLPNFPTFNVADAAISIGAGLLIVAAWRQR